MQSCSNCKTSTKKIIKIKKINKSMYQKDFIEGKEIKLLKGARQSLCRKVSVSFCGCSKTCVAMASFPDGHRQKGGRCGEEIQLLMSRRGKHLQFFCLFFNDWSFSLSKAKHKLPLEKGHNNPLNVIVFQWLPKSTKLEFLISLQNAASRSANLH